MKILKKVGVLACMVGMLAESPVMNVWAVPETMVMTRVLSESSGNDESNASGDD